MTHLEIYQLLFEIEKKMQKHFKENTVGNPDTPTALLLTVMDSVSTTIQSSIAILMFEAAFCGNCFYGHLNISRKALHRYSILEPELFKNNPLLTEIIDTLNKICISLKVTEATECGEIQNTAYGLTGL